MGHGQHQWMEVEKNRGAAAAAAAGAVQWLVRRQQLLPELSACKITVCGFSNGN